MSTSARLATSCYSVASIASPPCPAFVPVATLWLSALNCATFYSPACATAVTNEEAQIAALCPQSGGGGKTQGSESCGLPPLADGVFVTVFVRSLACCCVFCLTVVAAFLRAVAFACCCCCCCSFRPPCVAFACCCSA